MNQDICEIGSITFGVFSPQEIRNMSVAEINKTTLTGGPGTVYDDRLGTIDNSKTCETCHQNAKDCPGHFGHIELNEPIIHPLYPKKVLEFLRCFCIKCNRLLILKDQIVLDGINKYKGSRRFEKILEKLEKIDECCQEGCSHPQPEIKYTVSEGSMAMVYKQKGGSKISIILTVEEIEKTFDNVSDEDVELLGLDPALVHPRNFILTVFPVIPPCARPYVIADGNTCDDDLTNQLVEIIKSNNHLDKEADPTMSESKRQKHLQSLKFRISTFYNNSNGRAKHTTNRRPIKGLKERMTGKTGIIRSNLNGKRANIKGTKVILWNGNIKNVEDIVIGDVVIGDDGKPRNVVDVLEGESPIYTVKQSSGDDYGISCEHILTLKYSPHCKITWCECQGLYGGWIMSWYDRNTKTVKSKKSSVLPSKTVDEARQEIEDIKIGLGLPKTKNVNWCPNRRKNGTWRLSCTIDGEEKSIEVAVVVGKTKKEAFKELEKFRSIIDTNNIIDIHVKDYLALAPSIRSSMLGVKLSTPVMWEKKEVKLDPYILGMWLGDGTSRGREFTSIDAELVDYWTEWATKHGAEVKKYDKLHYGVKGKPNPLINGLRHYDLIYNKHVPKDYIVNDEETRFKLLAGLIDTNGSVEQEGVSVRITQCFKHRPILEGAMLIARSLGFRANMNTRNVSWTGKDGLTNCGKALILSISGDIGRIPTLLPHKKCKSAPAKDMCSYKIEVVDAGIGKFYGFEVDENHRFLLGDFTITHNCEQTARTVAGGDPTLKVGQLGVPYEVSKILTVPVQVTSFNIKKLTDIVNNNGANFVIKNNGKKSRINLRYALYRKGTELLHGDVIVRGDDEIKVETGREKLEEGDRIRRGDEYIQDVRAITKKHYKLEHGDIVERKLCDGDYVLLNRQPTLHKASMQAMEVKLMRDKTFRINLAITKSMNADFDGDEVNY